MSAIAITASPITYKDQERHEVFLIVTDASGMTIHFAIPETQARDLAADIVRAAEACAVRAAKSEPSLPGPESKEALVCADASRAEE